MEIRINPLNETTNFFFMKKALSGAVRPYEFFTYFWRMSDKEDDGFAYSKACFKFKGFNKNATQVANLEELNRLKAWKQSNSELLTIEQHEYLQELIDKFECLYDYYYPVKWVEEFEESFLKGFLPKGWTKVHASNGVEVLLPKKMAKDKNILFDKGESRYFNGEFRLLKEEERKWFDTPYNHQIYRLIPSNKSWTVCTWHGGSKSSIEVLHQLPLTDGER